MLGKLHIACPRCRQIPVLAPTARERICKHDVCKHLVCQDTAWITAPGPDQKLEECLLTVLHQSENVLVLEHGMQCSHECHADYNRL